MQTLLRLAAVALAAASFSTTAFAASKTIDLRTVEGVKAVKGEWRYIDVKLVEVPTKTTDGKPITRQGRATNFSVNIPDYDLLSRNRIPNSERIKQATTWRN